MNQNARRKYPTRDNHNRNNTYISFLNDNQEQHEQYWGQQAKNYIGLKDEITATVTNHTNKLIDNLEMKYQQMNRKMEKRQDEALDRLDKTLENFQRQNNFRKETENMQNNRNIDNNNMHHNNNQNNRQQENRTRRTNSIQQKKEKQL